MASLALNTQQDFAYEFYKKYLWKELSVHGEQQSGWILRTIYRQFGNWCIKRKYMIGDNNDTKLFWFKTMIQNDDKKVLAHNLKNCQNKLK